jgi:hypothetical protein
VSAREARLKAEYADEYPGITPDLWIPTTELAHRLIARVQVRGDP